jgi:hypothetical protein
VSKTDRVQSDILRSKDSNELNEINSNHYFVESNSPNTLCIFLLCFFVSAEHFILFLCYTWIGCTFALLIFSMNYFFCNSADCTFDSILVQLVRVMTVLCVATLLFVSSMIMNVTYGVMTGVGTIDRLKKKATNTINEGEEEPLGLKDIFGIQGYWTWMFPIDPVFEDYDLVMGYSIPQRLTREKQRETEFEGNGSTV